MDEKSGFIAYPSIPSDLAVEIREVSKLLSHNHGISGFSTWEENDIAGRFLVDPILEKIAKTSLLVADITKLNFNVAFEIGYAIGCEKRVALVLRADIAGDRDKHAHLGIFDTLGYKSYSNASELATIVVNALKDTRPLTLATRNTGRPRLFMVEPDSKDSYDISLLGAIKKSKVPFERYDPIEKGRLNAKYAIACVSGEDAFVARFLPSSRDGAVNHNIRVSFCAGIAHALNREYLLFQNSQEPVALDYRDLVEYVPIPGEISHHVGELVLGLYDQQDSATRKVGPSTILTQLSLGSSIAENEGRRLSDYYLKTEQFKQAERGEVQVVTGRKGAGKTAFFLELRNSLRRNPNNIILDLQPEGFQILKFKERCLKLLSDGSKEHLLTALWEYVILLEVVFRILRDERVTHVYNHKLNQPYREISSFVESLRKRAAISDDGDFAERLDRVLGDVEQKLIDSGFTGQAGRMLSNDSVTEVLYSVDLREVQKLVDDYIVHKAGLWILVDNLDKGWPATGVTDDDTRIIRCLQSALRKIERSVRKQEAVCCGLIFVRSDVYDLLVAATPDKGKIRKISLDLSNKAILREVLRLRIADSLHQEDVSLENLWPQICITHIGQTAEESSNFILDRSLMRPRALLDLVQACLSNAVTLNHNRIEGEDLEEGLENYSVELAKNIGFEIRDVYSTGEDIIYSLIGSKRRLSRSKLDAVLDDQKVSNKEEFIDLLLWYGVLGLVGQSGETKFIYDERYEMMKLKAVHGMLPAGADPTYEINPAFWSALDVDDI